MIYYYDLPKSVKTVIIVILVALYKEFPMESEP